jgi:hypothetical protein
MWTQSHCCYYRFITVLAASQGVYRHYDNSHISVLERLEVIPSNCKLSKWLLEASRDTFTSYNWWIAINNLSPKDNSWHQGVWVRVQCWLVYPRNRNHSERRLGSCSLPACSSPCLVVAAVHIDMGYHRTRSSNSRVWGWGLLFHHEKVTWFHLVISSVPFDDSLMVGKVDSRVDVLPIFDVIRLVVII